MIKKVEAKPAGKVPGTRKKLDDCSGYVAMAIAVSMATILLSVFILL